MRIAPLLLIAGIALPGVARASSRAAENTADAVRAYEHAYTARRDAAIPSFSRQTGLACNVCHTTFPQLTPFGRRFKLNGYTLTGMQLIQAGSAKSKSLKLDLIPPVSAMAQASVTATSKAVPDQQNAVVGFPQELSLFFGEAITPKLGTFLQITYDPAEGSIGMDNADIRYANHMNIGSSQMTYGFTLNNNPSVQDVWNTTPAWRFPFAGSETAPAPNASVLLDGALAQQVAGLGAYGFFKGIYGEFSLYRSAPQGADPPNAGSENSINNVAPYWRVAFERDMGAQALELGTYGMHAELYPAGITGPLDHYTDVGVDGQWEYRTGGGIFTAHATWIHESRTLNATFAAGDAAKAKSTLKTFRADGSYYTSGRLGLTAGYFATSGDADTGLYPTNPIDGSATASPNSSGIIAELDYLPWLNTRFGLQYTAYTKFNGGTTGYDGSGRNASDNNTLYFITWLMF